MLCSSYVAVCVNGNCFPLLLMHPWGGEPVPHLSVLDSACCKCDDTSALVEFTDSVQCASLSHRFHSTVNILIVSALF